MFQEDSGREIIMSPCLQLKRVSRIHLCRVRSGYEINVALDARSLFYNITTTQLVHTKKLVFLLYMKKKIQPFRDLLKEIISMVYFLKGVDTKLPFTCWQTKV